MTLSFVYQRKRNLTLIFALATLLSFLFLKTECVTLNSTSLDVKDVYKLESNDAIKGEDHITVDIPSPRISNSSDFVYKKCYCDIQKIWNNGECTSEGTEEVVTILEDLQPNPENFLNFIFSKVEIQDVVCSGDKQLVDIIQDEFYILETGELYHVETDTFFSRDDYCFELVQEKSSIETLARACLSPPKVPSCFKDQAYYSVHELNLNILFGINILHWKNFNFSKPQELSCGEGSDHLILPLEDASKNFNFLYNAGVAQLLWQAPFPARIPLLFSSKEYCMAKNPSNSLYEIQICYNDPVKEHERLCKDATCLRKCCPKGFSMSSLSRSCISSQEVEEMHLPLFYNFKNRSLTSTPDNLILEYSFPWCNSHPFPYVLDPQSNPEDEYIILNNGSLYITLSSITMPPSQFCIDNFSDENKFSSVMALTCFQESKEVAEMKEERCNHLNRTLYRTLIGISCLFLFIILTVYAAIPELHSKQLHGKSLLSHVLSLLVAFLCQLILSWSSNDLTMTGCKIIALANQVSFLWAFFWLNVMCFDIWWTLKTMNPSQETGESSRRRFYLYSLYAWGCPLVICFVTAIMEFLPSYVDKKGLILPGFGIRECWFKDAKSTWLYFYGFALFVYVLNILFFFHVAAILIRGQRSTEGILRTTRKQHQERVYLYLKLFVVMGITWVCEVSSWQEGNCMLWVFTDIINSLQGVFIFFIFMFNKKVFQKIQAKGVPIFRRMKSLVQPTPSSVGSADIRSNSSSQRTTQTSTESSLRKLSTSLPPSDGQFTNESKKGGLKK